MVNGAFNFCFGTFDFLRQRDDARLQFGDGKRVKILTRKRIYRVIRPAREIFIHVHGRNVDAYAATVNNGFYGYTNGTRHAVRNRGIPWCRLLYFRPK